MTAPPAPYQPINCEFHDVLEATATRRRIATIRFVDDAGAPRQRQARIADLTASDGVEYVVLDSGERIRLDRLLSVDDQTLADYTPPS